MTRRPLKTIATLCILAALGCAASPPPTPAPVAPAAVALTLPPPRPGRVRPLVVVAASHRGSETVDLVVPYGVIKGSGVADVVLVSTRAGSVPLHPALTVQADMSMDEFDNQHPDGADLVVVPAVHDPGDPALLAWLVRQRGHGAALASVCDGAWVLANAGLLAGRQATTFWYSQADIARQFPETRWVKNRRWVVDGPVMSTAGVSAALPAALAIVEAIGGPAVARRTAEQVGAAPTWDDRHATDLFALRWRHRWTYVANTGAFWRHETLGMPLEDGVNEVALALHADAWARTHRTRVRATHPQGRIVSARGLRIDAPASDGREDLVLAAQGPHTRVDMANMLDAIARHHGPATRELVALEMEYPLP